MKLKNKTEILYMANNILNNPAILEDTVNTFKYIIEKRQKEIDTGYSWPKIDGTFSANINIQEQFIRIDITGCFYSGETDNINKHLESIPTIKGVTNIVRQCINYNSGLIIILEHTIFSRYTKEDEMLLRNIGVIKTRHDSYTNHYDSISCDLPDLPF